MGRPATRSRIARALGRAGSSATRLWWRIRARHPLDSRTVSLDRATLDDVYSCYRLFLQRTPDAVGFGAYAAQVERGLSVRDLVSYFVGCPEWIRRELYKTPANTSLARVGTSDFELYVLEADPVVARELIHTGAYEPHVAGRIRSRLGPGDVFVDVGANVGYYTLLASRLVGPTGKVLAFEPNQANVKVLMLNRLHNRCDNVTIYPFAASREEGLLALMKIVSIASTKEPTEDDLRYLNAADMVYATTLDRVLATEPRVDVIKCDIDGHDFLAMQGASRTLATRRPVVFAEFNPGTLKEFSRIDPIEYLRLFVASDYRIDVLLRSGELVACGSDCQRVMALFADGSVDQVDLMLLPA